MVDKIEIRCPYCNKLLAKVDKKSHNIKGLYLYCKRCCKEIKIEDKTK